MKNIILKNWQYVLARLICLWVLTLPAVAYAAEPSSESIGTMLPLWSVFPFVGMLLSIAIFPLLNKHWWEHNMHIVGLMWGVLFLLPFAVNFGIDTVIYNILHIYIIDYIPFIILLFGLYTISGGLVVGGSIIGTPKLNTAILLIGCLLASVIGTTGAAMILIRPLIRANMLRDNKVHTIIFFIFLVCNIGGSLTPLGDPPLFLGFLHGVPFFWTLSLLPIFLLNVALLLTVYWLLESYLYKKEQQTLLPKLARMKPVEQNHSIRVSGLINMLFLFGVIVAVILSGLLTKSALFYDGEKEVLRGIALFSNLGHTVILTWINVARDSLILLMAFFSWKITPLVLRQENHFTWGPMKEVAVLFAGIFATIIPAIAILQARGGVLGISSPAQFFWASGMLSGFLDNAPTYLTFLSLAGGLELKSGIWTDLGYVTPHILMAISAGSVFMGANTYIGNAPNFMVRSIAEENNIEMPSFFAYMAWSICILIPLFILNTVLFF